VRVEKVEAGECGKGEAKVKVLESVVCPFCACLCDDVVVAVDEEAKRVKEVRNNGRGGVEKCREHFERGGEATRLRSREHRLQRSTHRS